MKVECLYKELQLIFISFNSLFRWLSSDRRRNWISLKEFTKKFLVLVDCLCPLHFPRSEDKQFSCLFLTYSFVHVYCLFLVSFWCNMFLFVFIGCLILYYFASNWCMLPAGPRLPVDPITEIWVQRRRQNRLVLRATWCQKKKKKFDSFSVKSDGSSSWRYFCQLSFWLPAQPSTHFNGNEKMSWCASSLLFKFYCLLWCIIQRFKASSFTIWTYGKKSCLGILWCRHYTVWSLCQIGFKARCCSRGLRSPLQKTRLKLTWLN